jgi:NAD(P)-dependent dehydrogenase (short-subunit alcohol dehydrogenase family)
VSRRVVAVLGVGAAGEAVIEALAQRGDTVLAVNRSIGPAEQALLRSGAQGSAYAVDLAVPDQVASWVAQVVDQYGSLDGVVHLVGGWSGGGGFGPQTLQHHMELRDPVLTTVQVVTAHVAHHLLASARGAFVMVSSTAVAAPTAGNAAYASLKGAAEIWTTSMADHFGDSAASATIVRVKALVDEQMRSARPEAHFRGFTEVSDLASAILDITDSPASSVNGRIIDLTSEEYSRP